LTAQTAEKGAHSGICSVDRLFTNPK